MKLTFENNLRTCLLRLVVHQIMYKRNRIFPFFELLAERNATCHVYAYDDGTTRTDQLLNYYPLQITLNARLLGLSVLARSTCRLQPQLLLRSRPAGRKPERVNEALRLPWIFCKVSFEDMYFRTAIIKEQFNVCPILC